MVGVSRNPKDFSRALYREMRNRGYQMVPVNPQADEIDGDRCYARVTEIGHSVDGVMVMTPPDVCDSVVKDCAKAGVARVWMYRGAGHGCATDTALRFCSENEISVVPGECPFMFLSGGNWIHGAHRFCRKLVGSFPE
jgi:predicted CoA-binding protein